MNRTQLVTQNAVKKIILWLVFFCRRLKGGSIEPHPTENALIINYTLEATVFNEPGDAMLEKSKVLWRILRVIFFSRLIYFSHWRKTQHFGSVVCFHGVVWIGCFCTHSILAMSRALICSGHSARTSATVFGVLVLCANIVRSVVAATAALGDIWRVECKCVFYRFFFATHSLPIAFHCNAQLIATKWRSSHENFSEPQQIIHSIGSLVTNKEKYEWKKNNQIVVISTKNRQ